MVGADLRHVLLAEVQVYLAQVFLVQEGAALALVEDEVRVLPCLLVCRGDGGAQALGKVAADAFIVRKRVLVYIDLPADAAVFRTVRRNTAKIFIIGRTANVAHPDHLTGLFGLS